MQASGDEHAAGAEPGAPPAIERRGPYLAFVVLLGVCAAVGWWLHLRPVAETGLTSIEAISLDLGDWLGVAIPLEAGVERMLEADAQTQRRYRNPVGETVWLYVGYYGTARGGRPEHTPWACYPSTGWDILASEERPLVLAGRSIDGASLMELVVERNGARRLVHFWYATHRSTALATSSALTLDHLAGRLSPAGRADGALVRLSTPLHSALGLDDARDRLAAFATPLVAEIELHWPQGA